MELLVTYESDEICLTIMINDQFIVLPMKEAIRVYKRLGDLLNEGEKFPEGKLFDFNRKDNCNDNK